MSSARASTSPFARRRRNWASLIASLIEIERLDRPAAALDVWRHSAGFFVHPGQIEEERFDETRTVGRGVVAVGRQDGDRLLIKLAAAEIERGEIAATIVWHIHGDAAAIGGAPHHRLDAGGVVAHHLAVPQSVVVGFGVLEQRFLEDAAAT